MRRYPSRHRSSRVEHEREMISARTKAALQAARARGKKLGWSNPSRREEQARATANGAAGNRAKADQFAANIVPVVREIDAAGIRTLKGIAGALNARGVRTARGGLWHPTTVRNLLARDLLPNAAPQQAA
jgi:DNA invertase Pin-like site-specific DNA recombinase